MLLLGYINQDEYENAISQEIKIAKNINLYAVDAQHLAELVRQEVIDRYGLRAYKEGWSVYTTIDSSSQNIAKYSRAKFIFLRKPYHVITFSIPPYPLFLDMSYLFISERSLTIKNVLIITISSTALVSIAIIFVLILT